MLFPVLWNVDVACAKLVPPTVGPGGPVMAIQDGPGLTMAATNGPVMAAIIGPPLPSLVPWPGDLPWQP